MGQDHPDGGGGGGRPRRGSLVRGGAQGVGHEEIELSLSRRQSVVLDPSFSGIPADVQRSPVGRAARALRWCPTFEAAAVIQRVYCVACPQLVLLYSQGGSSGPALCSARAAASK